MPAIYRSLPFAEAIEYLRDKLDLPTAHWDDIAGQAHDKYFTVAGAAKAELLADLHATVLEAVESGTTLATFREDFERIVADHGWTGWTGEDTPAGRAWRTRTIYGTNLRTSHAAGRYSQMRSIAHRRPWWRYRHNPTVVTPREDHLSWDGLVLRHDDAWWDTHYPPNGWGCRCWVETLADRDLAREGIAPDEAPDDGTYEHVDRDGVVHVLPEGVQYGWDHAPGRTRDLTAELRVLADRALGDAPAGIGAAFAAATADQLLADRTAAFSVWADGIEQARGQVKTVGALSPGVVRALEDRQIRPQSAALAVRDADVLHTHRDTKVDALPWPWYRELPRHLAAPRAVLLDKTDPKGALLLVFDLPEGETGKLVVKVDYEIAARGADGLKRKRLANIVRSGRIVGRRALMDPVSYELLEGEL